jgi:hypothetical protein
MHRPELALLALVAAASGLAASARAQASDPGAELERLREQVARLEARVEDLEGRQARAAVRAAAAPSGPARDVRLGASATLAWFNGQPGSPFEQSGFDTWDGRLFLDAELARDGLWNEKRVFRSATLSFEWNLIRLGSLANTVGDLYVDLRELGGRPWLNAQLGRFQIPVGENYLRFGRGSADNPFLTNAVGAPWWWDEGLKLFGSDPAGRVGFVASLTDGEGFLNSNGDSDLQSSLKLWLRPAEWLYLSASALRSGEIGRSDQPEYAALWLGESWPRPVGGDSAVPTFQDGAAVSDASPELEGVELLGADAVAQLGPFARLWLAGGRVDVDAEGSSAYDRRLDYWLAELVVQGELFARALEPLYLALRGNGLGTYRRDEGYLLDFRWDRTLGYNARSLEAYSLGLGWRLARTLTLRAEYTRLDVDLVRGVGPAIREAAGRADFFGAGLTAHF